MKDILTIKIAGLRGEIPAPQVKMAGIEGYVLGEVHPDINGAWGGHQAMVAHFQPEGGEITDQRLYMYMLIGAYEEVGRWPDAPCKHSRWEIARLLAETLWKIDDADLDKLYFMLYSAIEKLL